MKTTLTLIAIVLAFILGTLTSNQPTKAAVTCDVTPACVADAISDPSIRQSLNESLNGSFEDLTFPIHFAQMRTEYLQVGDRQYFANSPVEVTIPEGSLTDAERDQAIRDLKGAMLAAGIVSK